ncbi:MAG: hypothetical protein V4494_01600 [Chlamydiota bacterium]
MPHLRLEYSTNVKEDLHPEILFPSCHRILVDTINADLSRCQSRAISRDLFYIGEGSSQEAFAYLEILLLEGRPLPKLQEMANQLLEVLKKYFSRSLQELNMQIAVRFVELPKSHYFKTESKIT